MSIYVEKWALRVSFGTVETARAVDVKAQLKHKMKSVLMMVVYSDCR